jgi:cysteine desulfurase family protein (TIGR01976 family)
MPPDTIRAQFPALARGHLGRPVAYFDGPGGTQVPSSVVEAMSDYLLNHNANTNWAYPTSIETDAIIAGARSAFADLFGSALAEEIVFGLNMTTLAFHIARALGRGWGPGDEVVVTQLDHQANVAPWRALAQERGITIRLVHFDPISGELDMEELARSINSRTKLVAIGAASNALGTINDIPRITRMAHAAGALAFVDAVHYAAHGLMDVRGWDCDLAVCSAYKLYGPHIGVLYGRRDLLAGLDVPKVGPAPDEPPERIETGTQNHEGIAGAAAAVDFLASLATVKRGKATRRARLESAFGMLHREGEALVTRLWDGLAAIPSVKLYGPRPGRPRTPTVVFTVRDLAARAVAEQLARAAVFVSHGDFYASTVIERLGVTEHGLVRAGCACYTTPDDVDRLIDAVMQIGD